MKKIIISLFILNFLSCAKKTLPNYSNKEFLEMGKKGDPDLKVIIPGSISETVVDCNEYTPACRYGLKVIVKNISLKALFYDDQKNALSAAKRFNGYISRNWALDDVRGEPILERYVVKYLNAVPVSTLNK